MVFNVILNLFFVCPCHACLPWIEGVEGGLLLHCKRTDEMPDTLPAYSRKPKLTGNGWPATLNFFENLPIFGSMLKQLIWDPSCCVQGCEYWTWHRVSPMNLQKLRYVKVHEERSSEAPLDSLCRCWGKPVCWECWCISCQLWLCYAASCLEPVLPASFCTQSKAQSSDPEHKAVVLDTKPLAEQHRRELRLFPGLADHNSLHLNAVRAGWTI